MPLDRIYGIIRNEGRLRFAMNLSRAHSLSDPSIGCLIQNNRDYVRPLPFIRKGRRYFVFILSILLILSNTSQRS
jgi:hypothetical protein